MDRQSFSNSSVNNPYLDILPDSLRSPQNTVHSPSTPNLCVPYTLNVCGVCGMHYLSVSNTPIKSHGRLKSSNCVIDNRWTLKITSESVHMSDMWVQVQTPHCHGS